MSIFRIAIRSIQQRGIASLLTTFSMSLGVMLVVIVISLHGLIAESFSTNSSVGYNMVIGSRGGSMQLALNSVYYLSKPLETIPYEYYLAFRDQADREAAIKDSIVYRARESQWNAFEIQTFGAPIPGLGPAAIMSEMVSSRAMQTGEAEEMGFLEPGMYANYTELAVPICLGDYFGEYRVVATTPEFADKIELNVRTHKMMSFKEGRNFRDFDEEHGFFECIVGSIVAKRMNVKLGDRINPTHGAPDGHTHENGFTVVGIIDESRTPNDRAVFINLEGFYLMSDHAKPINETDEGVVEPDFFGEDDWGLEDLDDETNAGNENGDESNSTDDSDASASESLADEDYSTIILQERLPLEQREVTSVLVRTAGADEEELAKVDEDERVWMELAADGNAMQITNKINEGTLKSTLGWTPFRPNLAQDSAMAISPVLEIRTLLDVFVRPIQLVLLLLTVMICIVAGLSILVSIYNSMNERTSEIAVMRALGARRGTVMGIILAETLMLSCAGGIAGWIAAHGLNVIISPYVEYHAGVSIGFFDFAPPARILAVFGFEKVEISPEWAIIPGLIVLSTIVGLYPAFAAYRTDVAKALSN